MAVVQSELTLSIRKSYQSKLIPLLQEVYQDGDFKTFNNFQLETIAEKLENSVYTFCKKYYPKQTENMYSNLMHQILWIIVWFYPVSDSKNALTINQCVQGILNYCNDSL